MELVIAGDLFIAEKYQGHELFERSLVHFFHETDYRILNLESPVTASDSRNRIVKTGPHLRTSEQAVFPYLNQLRTDMVTLANNHILDYGIIGLRDTLRSLRNHHIDYTGAGLNHEEVVKPHTIAKDGLKIAVLNFAENEWATAQENPFGANPLDIINNVKQIRAAKSTHDTVICIIHGGHEYYHLPSPRMVKHYRFYADNGADAIVGHHSHCIGGCEIYKEVPIIYSLGNFLFTLPSNKDIWFTGLLAVLKIGKHGPVSFELHPVRQSTADFTTKLLCDQEKEAILEHVEKLSRIIAQPELLCAEWRNFIEARTQAYLGNLSPMNAIGNRLVRALLCKAGFEKLFLTSKTAKVFLNVIRCEAHADITREVLVNYLREHE